MAMTLYHGEPNGPSLTVLAALFETGLEATLVRIDLTRGERHHAPVPAAPEVAMSVEGEGPVLVAEGVAMADSVFIAQAFDEMAGGNVLMPTDPYARWEVTTWCRWIIERIAPAAAFIGTRATLAPALAALDEAGFETHIAGIESVDLKARWSAVRAGDFDGGKLADSEAKIDAAVARVEAQLEGRDWLFGTFGVADLETHAWLASMVVFVPLAFTHATRTHSWMERVARRSSVARALALASVPDPRRSWAPGPEINRWG